MAMATVKAVPIRKSLTKSVHTKFLLQSEVVIKSVLSKLWRTSRLPIKMAIARVATARAVTARAVTARVVTARVVMAMVINNNSRTFSNNGDR